MPLAARRALDALGFDLPLAAWQSLGLEDRWRLIEAGSSELVGAALVTQVLPELRPGSREPWREPSEIPENVATASGELRGSLEALWSSLGGLERYALTKTLQSPRRSQEEKTLRFQEACRFFLDEEARVAAAPRLSHLNERGDARMVDVSAKETSERIAVAESRVHMKPETWRLLAGGHAPKGDVLAVARVAGIQAAKRTHELIPLCHIVRLSGVSVDFSLEEAPVSVRVRARAKALDRTGVEMEALVAASVAALTLYDMLKAVDRGMTITDVRLVSKSGGASGDYERRAS